MRIVVWNSQGAKWDWFYTNYVAPQVGAGTDVVGLLVESGWAPWVLPGEVYVNANYECTTGTTYYNSASNAIGTFAGTVLQNRINYGFWVPWMKTLDAIKTNTRCSMGGLIIPRVRRVRQIRSFDQSALGLTNIITRPVIRISFPELEFTIFLVHLISGYVYGAGQQVANLTAAVTRIVPQGHIALIVGDMNIDLLGWNLPIPNNWHLLNTGVATQKSGGELDYALLYDPSGTYANSAVVNILAQVQVTGQPPVVPPPPLSPSDHSALMYTINV